MKDLITIFGGDMVDRANEWLAEHPKSSQTLREVCEELTDIDAESDDMCPSWLEPNS